MARRKAKAAMVMVTMMMMMVMMMLMMMIMMKFEMVYLPVGQEEGKGSNCKGDEQVLYEDPTSQGGDRGVHLDDPGSDDDDDSDAHLRAGGN